MKTLKELLQPLTREQVRDRLLGLLYGRGYTPNDFVAGSEQRTILEVEAETQAELTRLAPLIAAGGYLQTAGGDWLDLLAASHYGLTRNPSQFAVYRLTLTDAAGRGPSVIAPGELWAATPGGRRYNNTAGGTLPKGGALGLEFRAESPGAAYNVPEGAIGTLLTPLPGVGVTNGTGSLLIAGADVEGDEALRRRCSLRWAELGGGGTRDAYEFWARTASSAVSRVKVFDAFPRGQGTVDVAVWGEGGIGGGDVDQVRAYTLARRPLTANVLVYAATERVVAVAATVKVRAGFKVAAQAAGLEALSRLQRDTEIGGTVYRSTVIDALVDRSLGVLDAQVTAPAADLVLGAAEALTFNVAGLVWAEV